ncbi:exodeoxyribonuclease VII large subunit [Candidatus Soleaferrea massiliensis]|uniref:exodeoxyribonuclease VII large subunit n=1 Tax=Candidatus Soleaferrea massiliensis TaxID=1470354 RepID=UPI0006950524|nr:exodeoxyribonuclease VII large subunit [Candidatus Soleaferrea massiliensis]
MIGMNILTVSQLNRYIGACIQENSRLSDIIIKGEISNFTHHYKTGHFFFVLKDEKSSVKAVMFQSHASQVPFRPQNGMSVLVRGDIRVFERDGIYQMYAYELQPDGVGALSLAFEQLKKKLRDEGLFDEAYKKPLPELPRNIAVVTSKTGAVLHDILHVLERRYPLAHVYLYPVQVQGDAAPGQMIEALRALEARGGIDVIILARGGGSLEELWAFNDEGLARAVFGCHIPVISAVGHETDYTICDFVADLRCPTPTAAAQMVAPDVTQLSYHLATVFERIQNRTQGLINGWQNRLERIRNQNFLKNHKFFLNKNRQRLDFLVKSIDNGMQNVLLGYSNSLLTLRTRLEAAGPLRDLSRGYALVRRDGRPVVSAAQLREGDALAIRFADGTVRASVTGVDRDEEERGV